MNLFVCIFLAIFNLALAHAGFWHEGIWREPGDVMIGFVVAAHDNNASMSVPFDKRFVCGNLSVPAALLVSQFRKTLRAVNEQLLPNVKIGYDVIDSCKVPTHAVDLASEWTSKKIERLYESSTRNNTAPPLVVVGAYNSRVTAPLAVFLQHFDIPLIGFASTSADLSDRRRYPVFARTSPSDNHQATAIAVMAATIGYRCVHLVFSEGLYGELGAAEVRRHLQRYGVCIASDQKAPSLESAGSDETMQSILGNIEKTPSAKAIICFCEDTTARGLVRAMKNNPHGVGSYRILASDFWGTSLDLNGLEDAAANAITVTVGEMARYDPAGFTEMAKTIENQDPWFQEMVEKKYSCQFNGTSARKCNVENIQLSDEDLLANPFTNSLKKSIFAVVNGIKLLFTMYCGSGAVDAACLEQINRGQMPFQLYTLILSTVNGTTNSPIFDKNGDGPANYAFKWYRANNINGENISYNYDAIATWRANGSLLTTTNFYQMKKIPSTCECDTD